MFAREISDPLTGLVKKIDDTVHAAAGKYHPRPGQKLGAFVIVPHQPHLADRMHDLAQADTLRRVTLCIGNAPPRYEINPNAYATIVIYTPGRPGQNTVTANFALRECELDDARAEAIIAALAKVLPK